MEAKRASEDASTYNYHNRCFGKFVLQTLGVEFMGTLHKEEVGFDHDGRA